MPKSRFAREYFIEDHLASEVPVLERKWYYEIEIEPGHWTRGIQLDNVVTTRTALQRLNVAGSSCLDIGCMEGLVSVLLERKGARRVVGYDRLNLSERIRLLHDKGVANFSYRYGFPLSELRTRLDNETFDVVVFSGVLYHMIDPFGGLLMARGFLKPGGIMIFESLLHSGRDPVAHFNVGGKLTLGGNNFWLVNTGLIDYLLRMCRLRPIDVYHTNSGTMAGSQRVCVVCEAVGDPVGAPDDDWISNPQKIDFAEYLDPAIFKTDDRAVCSYQPRTDVILHPWGSADVFAESTRGPLVVEDRRAQLGLPLGVAS